jgi:hypothetical protein
MLVRARISSSLTGQFACQTFDKTIDAAGSSRSEMEPYLLAAATLALVAILAIPHKGNPGVLTDPAQVSSEANLFSGSPNQRNSSTAVGQKIHLTPFQAQVSVVGSAFTH